MRDNDFLVSINHNSEAIMKKIVNIRYVLYERPQSDGRCWSDVSKLFAMILLRFGNSLELFIQNLKRIEDELAVPFLLQYSNNFSIVKYCEKLQIFSNFLHSSGRYFDVTYGKIEGIYPDEGKLTFLMNKIKELYTQLNELSVLIKNNLPPIEKDLISPSHREQIDRVVLSQFFKFQFNPGCVEEYCEKYKYDLSTELPKEDEENPRVHDKGRPVSPQHFFGK